MGLLIDGQWVDRWYDTDSSEGRFVRKESQFRHWVTADGSGGPSGEAGFAAAVGRYHLYVSLACPWAHRTLIFRALKGLEAMIGVTVVAPLMAERGWCFEEGEAGDPLYGATCLYELYRKADPGYSGRVTVPVLWDKERATIVSNESAEIIRMFNSAFDHLGAAAGDYYPKALQPQIDALNARIYERINNGVYRAGFATTQAAYEEAVIPLFELLDELDRRLASSRYLLGAQVTEADWRLFTTLIRFDPVYHGHFKCNLKPIAGYPHLSAYLRELYQWPGVAATVDFDQIKAHYYGSHRTINPTGIVPVGPMQDLQRPHGRDHLPGQQPVALPAGKATPETPSSDATD